MIFKNTMRNIICVSLVLLLAACGGAEERKAKYMEKGKEYFEAKNPEKARIEFKNVLQIDPKYSEAYYYIAQLEERDKNIGKAIGNYQKAVELAPEFVAAKVKLAKIYVVIGTDEYINKAKDLLAEALKKEPGNPEAHLISATIKYKTGDKDIAVKEIENVVSENKNLAEGIALLAAIYADQRAVDKARKVLEQGVKDNKDSIQLKITLAKLYAQNGEIQKAEQEIQEIIRMEPEKYAFRLALFSLYTTSNQLDKAEKVLRQAIEDDREDARRYLVLVEFISRNKSINDAESELKKFVQANPSLMSLRFALAEFYKKIKQNDKAKQVLNDIIANREYEKDEIRAKVELASIAFDEKDYATAGQLVEKVLADYPNNNDALLIRGKIALVNRDADTAINDLRTVFKNEPKNPEAAKLLAAAHEIAGQTSLAEDVLKKAIENNPVDAKNHYNYARYLIKNKRIDEASSVVDKALGFFHDSYELMELKLGLVAKQGNEQDVVAILDKIKMEFPDRPEPNLKKGQYYVAKKEYAKAREEFEQAMQKSTDKYQSLELIVNTYLAEKAPEKAIKRINDRLAKVENDPMSYQLLGKVYFTQKDMQKARQSFQQAIDAQQDWLVPYLNLAASYQADNNEQKAISIYQDAIPRVRNGNPARLQLATLYEKARNYDKAIEQYREIIKTEPDNLLVANNLASLLVESDPGEADINFALKLTRDFEKLQQPAFLDTLGWVYVKAGKYPEAVSILRRVVEKAPDIAVFKYHLGVALNKDGKLEEGNKYLQEAVDSKQQFMGKEMASKMLGS